ncbi:MAG: hypothetical protein AABX71_01135 [Nanoarchaeota archaeon]
MDIEKKLIEINGSFYLPVSRQHLEHIGIDAVKAIQTDKEKKIIIRDDSGKFGNFISFWKPKEEP